MQEQKSLARTAGGVSVATMISRILGLVREMVFAKYFSVFATDAFFAAFRIPNMLRNLFAEGALSAAFIPTFTDYSHKGKDQAWRLANIVINLLVIILSIFTLIVFFGSKYLVYFLVSGYAKIPGKIELTQQLTQVMAPFLLFIALSATVMGILNTHGRFFLPALAPAFFNLSSILSAIFLAPYMKQFGLEPIVAMAIGAVIGGALQLYIQIPSLYRSGYRYQSVLQWKHPGVKHIFTLLLPAVFGLAATQINILIDNQLASYLGDGPVSWLNYAFRLMQLPIGIFGISIATVNLTTVSRRIASSDLEGIRSSLVDAIELAAFLNIPATVGLILLRYPIVQLLYERGRFLPKYTIYTGDALLCYALGLCAYSLVKIITPVFYALRDTKTPVKFAVYVILAKIVVNLALIRQIGFVGLALGTSLATFLNVFLLIRALQNRIGNLFDASLYRTLFRITFASLIMGIGAWAMNHGLTMIFPSPHVIQRTLNLGLSIVCGIGILFAASHFLGIRQSAEVMKLLRKSSSN